MESQYLQAGVWWFISVGGSTILIITTRSCRSENRWQRVSAANESVGVSRAVAVEISCPASVGGEIENDELETHPRRIEMTWNKLHIQGIRWTSKLSSSSPGLLNSHLLLIDWSSIVLQQAWVKEREIFI